MPEASTARAIAFYLPQFHEVAENNLWWGDGFTEWTNTKKADRLFPGHQQPRIPTSLGYYNLLDPEAREQQAELAELSGIEGFCYWHYWFGNGRTILERPLQEVLKSRTPQTPFSLCWANESWTGVWHGAPRRVLMEQKYLGIDDYRNFFLSILPALTDDRYIRVNGAPIFCVYKPGALPNAEEFVETFRTEAIRHGLGDLFLVGMSNDQASPSLIHFDARMKFGPGSFLDALPPMSSAGRTLRRAMAWRGSSVVPGEVRTRLGAPRRFSYQEVVEYELRHFDDDDDVIPCLLPGWDNTPRSGRRGTVFTDCSPELFARYLDGAIEHVSSRPTQTRLIFIKAWNEWAEGNMLEPDELYQDQLVNVLRSRLVV